MAKIVRDRGSSIFKVIVKGDFVPWANMRFVEHSADDPGLKSLMTELSAASAVPGWATAHGFAGWFN